MKSRTLRVAGRKVKFRFVRDLRSLSGYKCWGLCDHNTVEIEAAAKGKILLDTLVHELVHVVVDTKKKGQTRVLHEDTVEELGTEIANVLWKLGYRRKGE